MSVADDFREPCNTFDEAAEELRVTVFDMQPGESLLHATIGQYSDDDHMEKKIAGKFYWTVTFTKQRTVGVDTKQLNPSDGTRRREAVRAMERAIEEGRAAVRQRMMRA